MTTLREHLEASGQPEFLALYERIHPRSYEELVRRIYEDLDACMGQLEADAKDFGCAGEEILNRELVRLLQRSCYQASHDHDEGGHVDVRIASRDGRFSWLAEAKIYRSNSYLDSGMDQLIDRYARGTPGHNRGGLLVYVQEDRCAEKFAAWRRFFEAQTAKYEELETASCAARTGLSFFGAFLLARLGAGVPKYEVRHMAVSLYRSGVAPDRSGGRKKRKAGSESK